jgi:L-alanine-DL-glutamate epimerase-like enolase superfamily enzyme
MSVDVRETGGAARVGVAAVERLDVRVYTVPTDHDESDGTYRWDTTTVVVVLAGSGDATGLGYTYGDRACATLIDSMLRGLVIGRSALAVSETWEAMAEACRNAGLPGVASMAISAVDTALWDLKARLLQLPLATLLDQLRPVVPVYGSGGFTSYTDAELTAQLRGWVDAGIPRVKMKVGRQPRHDLHRMRVARRAIGPDTELFIDANGAFGRKQALAFADEAAAFRVRWFEEPVSSDDLEGLRLIRDRGPAGMDVAAGEYGYVLPYFEHMLAAGAVDCLQADATRCGGITPFLRVAALCAARSMPLSAHCAPAIHVHPCCAAPALVHLEYFHDHTRIESLLFDGVLDPRDGALEPDLSRPGNGLELKTSDAQQYEA